MKWIVKWFWALTYLRRWWLWDGEVGMSSGAEDISGRFCCWKNAGEVVPSELFRWYRFIWLAAPISNCQLIPLTNALQISCSYIPRDPSCFKKMKQYLTACIWDGAVLANLFLIHLASAKPPCPAQCTTAGGYQHLPEAALSHPASGWPGLLPFLSLRRFKVQNYPFKYKVINQAWRAGRSYPSAAWEGTHFSRKMSFTGTRRQKGI